MKQNSSIFLGEQKEFSSLSFKKLLNCSYTLKALNNSYIRESEVQRVNYGTYYPNPLLFISNPKIQMLNKCFLLQLFEKLCNILYYELLTWLEYFLFYFSVLCLMTTQTVPLEYIQSQRKKKKKQLTRLQYFIQQNKKNMAHTQTKPWKV